jgi:hypothetical protein
MGRRAYLPVGRQEKWYFSIIDVISALTGNDRPRKYWNDLKTKLMREGSELSDKIGQLNLPAEDGKEFTWCLLRAWPGPMHIGRQRSRSQTGTSHPLLHALHPAH